MLLLVKKAILYTFFYYLRLNIKVHSILYSLGGSGAYCMIECRSEERGAGASTFS